MAKKLFLHMRKAGHTGKVPEKKTVVRDGKSYQQTFWVNPISTGKEKTLNWDEVDNYVNALTVEDFGGVDEIIKMAKPLRGAINREEAIIELKKIAAKGMMISRSGLKATLPNRNIAEIVHVRPEHIPQDQIEKTRYYRAHFLAAANLDKLYSNAIEPKEFTLNPNKNNQDIKQRHYLFSPIEYDNKIYPVTITVKEYMQPDKGTKIYAIEFISVELAQKNGAASKKNGQSHHVRRGASPSSTSNVPESLEKSIALLNLKKACRNMEKIMRGRK